MVREAGLEPESTISSRSCYQELLLVPFTRCLTYRKS